MSQGARRETRTVIAFTAVFLGSLGLALMWAVSVPLFSSPDEPSHVIRAAGVSRGEIIVTLMNRPTTRNLPAAPGYFRVPAGYIQAEPLSACVLDRAKPASCVAPMPDTSDEAYIRSFAANYPPLYYALVGWPSLVEFGDNGVFLMRMCSGLVFAVLVSGGLTVLPRRPGTLAGALVALTPMTWYLGGTVNPNGFEIASGFALFAALLALTRTTDGHRRAIVWLVAAVGLTALLNSRTTSPLWALLLVALAVGSAHSNRVLSAVRTKGMIIATVVAAVAAATSLAWILGPGKPALPVGAFPQYQGNRLAIVDSIGMSRNYYEQMIGVFGWLETPSPYAAIAIWSGLVGSLVVLALSGGRRRESAAVVGLLAAIVIIPTAIQQPLAADAGLVWQGRYLLPLAVALPMLAGAVVDDALPERLVRRFAWTVAIGFTVATSACAYWVMRRYAFGFGGPLFGAAPQWEPAAGWWPSVVLFTIAAGVLCAGLGVLGRRPRLTGA